MWVNMLYPKQLVLEGVKSIWEVKSVKILVKYTDNNTPVSENRCSASRIFCVTVHF